MMAFWHTENDELLKTLGGLGLRAALQDSLLPLKLSLVLGL